MSRKGNCWDNAVAESFFSSLKKERIKKHHLGGLSPEQFEAAHKLRRASLH